MPDLITRRPNSIVDWLYTQNTDNVRWFHFDGEEVYDNLVVEDGYTKPTEQQCLDGLEQLKTDFDLSSLREERNKKLAETDWVVTMHKEKGTNIPTAWKTYRQALRDITDTYTSLDDVVWPEKP